ncbi:MAG: hypothetical protein PVH31_08950, partial [Ectothiorhodospiraceae bacterium]
EWLRSGDRRPSLHQRCLHQHRDAIGWPMREHLVRVDLAALEEEVTNPNRFREVSVLVADYAMPEMNGLALCGALGDRPVKRILLTGVGDEKLAVSAFNDGLIDRFVLKSQPNVAEEVNRAIESLQQEYFNDVSKLIRQSLAGDEAPFLADPAFAAVFHELVSNESVAEYYFVAEPNGFLMLTPDGRAKRLVVLTEADMTVHWEIARDQHAPADLTRLLGDRARIPYFWRSGGYYRPELSDWEQYLYPPRVVDGAQRYYLALIDDPPAYRELGWNITSYNSFLSTLDKEAAAGGSR